MGETAPTEEIGRLLADKVLSKFGWKSSGPVNQNFECVEQKRHAKLKAKTHPGDVVFHYPDPYLGMEVYLHVDLKSYAAQTLEKADLKGILKDLAISVECANKSREWARLYDETTGSHAVHGLLFIYNHDGNYDKNFPSVLQQTGDGVAQLPPGKRIYVIGPERALYLFNVAQDIRGLQGDQELPADSGVAFFHPDLHNTRIQTQQYGSATVETLLSPWQVLRFQFPKQPEKSGHLIYYAGKGESVQEFTYLLDYIFTYQLLGDEGTIRIRLPFGGTDASNIFEKAKTLYGSEFWSIESGSQSQFQERLKRISCCLCTQMVPCFSKTEIGLKRHG
jgi:hypothetical protein